MKVRTHDFAATPLQLRKGLEVHREWFEKQLSVRLRDAAIFAVDLDLTAIAGERILGVTSQSASSAIRRFRSLVVSAETPAEIPPMLRMSEREQVFDLCSALGGGPRYSESRPAWGDCPVAFSLKGISHPMVAVNVAYRTGIGSECEEVARLVLVRRDGAAEFVRLLEDLTRRDNEPTLNVFGGSARRIIRCEWNDLVLDKTTATLLRDDFEDFFDREPWFRQHRLPFRRGYLLHGPPGNGKTTAIRAMMTSRGLTAYTMRLFDQRRDDDDLDQMFENAWRNRPSMIVFEDLDRAFPKAGNNKSNISLQQLLNSLDGIGTGEGTIVVATANEPALLDAAILRRPGRFDRVVHFPNPTSQLREAYFRHLRCNVSASGEGVVAASEGFSFAQLREAYILAGQQAFARGGELTEEDLRDGIQVLRQGALLGSSHSTSAGFTSREKRA